MSGRVFSRRTTALGIASLVIATPLVLHAFKRQAMPPSPPLPALQTVCIGRQLIDLPADMTPVGDVEIYYGLDKDFQTAKIEPLMRQATQRDLETAIARRTAELTGSYEKKTPSHNDLANTRRLDDQAVLIRAHDEPVMQGYFLAEILFLRDGHLGRLTRHVYDTDDPKDIEAKLITLLHHITVADDPAHAGKGTCLGGFVIDDGQDGEDFTVGMRSPAHPDLTMDIDINSMIAMSDGGLLQRWDSKADMLAKLGALGNTIRRGKITMAGRPAEEHLSDAKEKEKGKLIRVFHGETLLVKPATFAEPQIHFSMSMGGQVPTGEYVDASLSEKDSLALWDRIIQSIRPRPGAV